MSHVNGDVTHHFDAAVAAIRAQRLPLTKEFKLQILLALDGSGKSHLPIGERLWIARHRLVIPFGPDVFDTVELLQRDEERVVLQPGSMFIAEGLKRLKLLRLRLLLEIAVSPFQQGGLPLDHPSELHLVLIEGRHRGEVAFR